MRIFLVILIVISLSMPLLGSQRPWLLSEGQATESQRLFLLRVVSIDQSTHQMLLTPAQFMENETPPKEAKGQPFYICTPSTLPLSLEPGDLIRMWGTLGKRPSQPLPPTLLKGAGNGTLPVNFSPGTVLEIHGNIAASSPGSRLDPTGVRRRLLKKRSPFSPRPPRGGSGRP